MSWTDLSPVTLLQQEIQTLTSAMRRNQRWASTSTSSYQASSAPLPPAFRPSNGKRSRGDSNSSRRGRGSSEGAEEGDLMLGFVELRRTLTSVKGELPFEHVGMAWADGVIQISNLLHLWSLPRPSWRLFDHHSRPGLSLR
jgi:hypothetical protein